MDPKKILHASLERGNPPAVAAALKRIGEGVLLLAAAVENTSPASPGDLLPLAAAARAAGTSVRVVRDAIRSGELTAYGRQRDRAIRRADLDAWIESRRVVHEVDEDLDAEIERRMQRGRRAS